MAYNNYNRRGRRDFSHNYKRHTSSRNDFTFKDERTFQPNKEPEQSKEVNQDSFYLSKTN